MGRPCQAISREQLVDAVEKADFEVEHVECYGFPLANVSEVLRAGAYGRKLKAKRSALKTDDAMTADSGSDRSTDVKYWPIYSSAPSALLMKAFCKLQRPFLNTELGNGFILMAKAH